MPLGNEITLITRNRENLLRGIVTQVMETLKMQTADGEKPWFKHATKV